MEDLLQCSICCINYNHQDRTPRQLPCQHILCSLCLPFMVKKRNADDNRQLNLRPAEFIECPICKQEHYKTINEIPKSLLISQLVDAAKTLKLQTTYDDDTQPPLPASSQLNEKSTSNNGSPKPTNPNSPPSSTRSSFDTHNNNNTNNSNPFLNNPTTAASTNPFAQADDPFDYNYLANRQQQIEKRVAPMPPPTAQPLSPTFGGQFKPPYPVQPPAYPSASASNNNYDYPPPTYMNSQAAIYKSYYNNSAPQRPPYPQQQQPQQQQYNNYQPSSHNAYAYSQASSAQAAASSQSATSSSAASFDYRTVLRRIFDEMDVNRDGSITAPELQEALRRGQSSSSEFNLKTVEIILDKFDKNGDREISFDEFSLLFTKLNEEFENFLLMDADDSGQIDIEEFSHGLKTKGYDFSPKFYKLIFDEIKKKTGHKGINFDYYIRIAARFDYLCKFYRITPYYQKTSLESYLKKTFFQNFW